MAHRARNWWLAGCMAVLSAGTPPAGAAVTGEPVAEALFDLPALPLDEALARYDAPRAAPAAPSAPARLGFAVRPLATHEQQLLRVEGGLLVQRVNAAASRAGVQPGDLILAFNGQPIDSAETLANELEVADGAAALLVQRGATRLFVPICARAGQSKC